MRLSFRYVTSQSRFLGMHKRLQSKQALNQITRAVGQSAIEAQDHARDNLQSMVYDQPPALGGYKRTWTLMRGMSAFKSSRPNTGQHAKAASGIDLRATDPLAVVEVRGRTDFRSAVGNPVEWAQFVIDGVRQPGGDERPFMDGVQETFENSLQRNIDAAWLNIGKLA